LTATLPPSPTLQFFDAVSKHFPQGPDDKHVNARRWFNHIVSFSESERQAFPEPTKKEAAPAHHEEEKKEETKAAPAQEEESVDDDDLFGEVDEAALEEQKKQRAAAAEHSKKALPIAKSNVILDVKPWDDETDLVKMEQHVRSISMDGLVWGPSKFAEVAYGIKKLQISCVVEDEKVSTEDLEERITSFDEFVQSVDIAAFTKV